MGVAEGVAPEASAALARPGREAATGRDRTSREVPTTRASWRTSRRTCQLRGPSCRSPPTVLGSPTPARTVETPKRADARGKGGGSKNLRQPGGLRISESKLLGDSLWTSKVPPLHLRICLSQTLGPDPAWPEQAETRDWGRGRGFLTTPHSTTTCVPSFFCPRNRTTSEVVVYRALDIFSKN